jgi:hypothetical protein
MERPKVVAKYVCGYLIHFSDGGGPEERVLHRGALEECQRIGTLMLAVSYSGGRPDPKCEFVIVPEEKSSATDGNSD